MTCFWKVVPSKSVIHWTNGLRWLGAFLIHFLEARGRIGNSEAELGVSFAGLALPARGQCRDLEILELCRLVVLEVNRLRLQASKRYSS